MWKQSNPPTARSPLRARETERRRCIATAGGVHQETSALFVQAGWESDRWPRLYSRRRSTCYATTHTRIPGARSAHGGIMVEDVVRDLIFWPGKDTEPGLHMERPIR